MRVLVGTHHPWRISPKGLNPRTNIEGLYILGLLVTSSPKRHCKKRLAVFPSPAWMSLTKLSLAGNNLIIPNQGEFGKWHPVWDGKIAILFYSVENRLRLASCPCKLEERVEVRMYDESCKELPGLSRAAEQWATNVTATITHSKTSLTLVHCKDTIPKIWNKYSQRRNRAPSVLISSFMCLWAIYIFPGMVRIFCCRRICGWTDPPSHECGNWNWGRAIPFLGIHKWDFRCRVYSCCFSGASREERERGDYELSVAWLGFRREQREKRVTVWWGTGSYFCPWWLVIELREWCLAQVSG